MRSASFSSTCSAAELRAREEARESRKPFYLRTKTLIAIVSFVNLLNFMDRGIIPGATNEVNAFIDGDLHTETPDVYLGLLQSSFVIGYMVGSLLFGHAIHHYGRFFLTAVGCSVWVVAVMLSGIAALSGSYVFLLLARVLSGFGEAGLQCSIPPWIQTNAPADERGRWLAVFYTAIPVGTALGYAVSSLVAQEAHWAATFFLEGMIMLPFVAFLFFVSPYFPCETLVPSEDSSAKGSEKSPVNVNASGSSQPSEALYGRVESDPDEDDEFEGIVGTPGHHVMKHPKMSEEFFHVMDKTLFIAFTLAYAAQTAALIGVSTFGSAFLMGLGFFDKQSEASTSFGAIISVAGIVATPLGGIWLDRVLREEDPASEEEKENLSKPLLEDDASQLAHTTSAPTETEIDLDMERDFADKEDSPHVVHKHIRKLSLLLTFWSIIAVFLLSIVYFVSDVGLYLTLIGVGAGFVFLTNSAINMGVMLSVPVRHRAFAIALNVVFLHALGDVPSPLIVGFIKDKLAPDCSSAGEEDDAVATSDACRDEAAGLRLTMLLTTLWLTWTAFFCLCAWALNERRMWHVSSLCGCARPDEADHTHTGKKTCCKETKEREDEKRRQENEKLVLSICAMEESHVHSASQILQEELSSHQTASPVKNALQNERFTQEREKDNEIERQENRRSRVVPAEDFVCADEETQRRSVERLKRISRERSHGDLLSLTHNEAWAGKLQDLDDCVEI